MPTDYKFNINNPDFSKLMHIDGVANLNEAHDRSAPSDYHWKILKCRMIIFSESSLLASPNKADTKKIHIICSKTKKDYEKVGQLFQKISLTQGNDPKNVTVDMYEMCLQYTIAARLAPSWNLLGQNIFVQNRDFLIAQGMQEAVICTFHTRAQNTAINVRALKVNLLRYEKPQIGDSIRVLPSLFKAVVVESYKKMPERGSFHSYKDLKRHWKNIHGYRLPEKEGEYYAIQFWRGEPLTYPEICLLTQAPIQVPVPKAQEESIIAKFIQSIEMKFPHILSEPICIVQCTNNENSVLKGVHQNTQNASQTQAISLCTPTQRKNTNND